MRMLTTISGYPEWLPEDRFIEQYFVQQLQTRFELYGFAPLETRAIEPLPVILAKGETDKEIYVLRRLQATEGEGDKEIGLHFDLTIPFARYVLENRSQLTFPFRRYQIQKAWRGERPGQGRYREFLQADLDIVDERPLTVDSDLEVIQTTNEIMACLPIPQVHLLVNNRKLLEGFYRAQGIEAVSDVLRVVDKLEKIGASAVYQQLTDDLGLRAQTAEKCIQLGQIKGRDIDAIFTGVKSFGVNHPLLEEGLDELAYLLKACNRQAGSSVYADLSIARGLDYYTGTVCEGRFAQFPKYPTIVAGGRYDNLASQGSVRLPGMGLSIGVTRILGLVLHEGLLRASRKSPACVLVALISEQQREQSQAVAQALRNRGIACEIYPHPLRYGKQIGYAEKKGIPFVWFPDESGQGPGEVRDLRKREQVPADPAAWMPDPADLSMQIVRDEAALQELLQRSPYT
jgi:histidyl-tRNA synthetase